MSNRFIKPELWCLWLWSQALHDAQIIWISRRKTEKEETDWGMCKTGRQ
jgi:hypothetical protein